VPALAVTALILSGCGGGGVAPPGGGGVGEFAAYSWKGKAVSSVHAAWRVPEIEERSPCGVAGTWVGAIGEGQTFIQVGTNEECVKPSDGLLSLKAEYVVFWSDTSQGYHPHTLFHARPGDLIEATLDIRHRRWHLTIVDGTTASRASFTTTDETHWPPYIAEWAQEDVQSEAPTPSTHA
jgi:hypothetical protein